MEFNTKYKANPGKPEVNSGIRIVETAGYVPLNAQIQQFINAGKRLEDYRKQYDFGLGQPVPEDFIDPLKKKNLDIVDVELILKSQIQEQKAKSKPPEVKNETIKKVEEVKPKEEVK